MKELSGVLLITAVLIGASAAAVGPMGDREVFTPPPEAVAEGFFRAVMNSRYDQARAYLTDPEGTSNEALRSLEVRVESAIGDVHDVKADLVSRTDQSALVNVRLKSAHGSEATGTALEWRDGEWRVVLQRPSDTIAADARRRTQRSA